jgi:hypothetical protein
MAYLGSVLVGLSIYFLFTFYRYADLLQLLIQLNKNTLDIIRGGESDDVKQVKLLKNSGNLFNQSLKLFFITLLVSSPAILFYLYYQNLFDTFSFWVESTLLSILGVLIPVFFKRWRK